jgi:hypothetical protein
MTGIGARPEIVIEGSLDNKIWKEYEFLYKPGNVSEVCKFNIPHQPRFDWQAYFTTFN